MTKLGFVFGVIFTVAVIAVCPAEAAPFNTTATYKNLKSYTDHLQTIRNVPITEEDRQVYSENLNVRVSKARETVKNRFNRDRLKSETVYNQNVKRATAKHMRKFDKQKRKASRTLNGLIGKAKRQRAHALNVINRRFTKAQSEVDARTRKLKGDLAKTKHPGRQADIKRKLRNVKLLEKNLKEDLARETRMISRSYRNAVGEARQQYHSQVKRHKRTLNQNVKISRTNANRIRKQKVINLRDRRSRESLMVTSQRERGMNAISEMPDADLDLPDPPEADQ